MLLLACACLACAWWAAGAQQQQPRGIISSSSSGGGLASLSFPVVQPFGSLPLSRAGCCPYAGMPVLPQLPGGTHPLAVIVGAQKSGTTLLYQLLTAHPNIVTHSGAATATSAQLSHHQQLFREKEAHYFDRPPLDCTYQQLLNYFLDFSRAQQGSVLLDATPAYLPTAWAACRMKAAAPHAKLVLLLKDPVARAFSSWRMWTKARLTHTPPLKMVGFADMVEAEIRRLEALNCTFRGTSDSSMPKRSWNDCFQCMAWGHMDLRGLCADYMVRWVPPTPPPIHHPPRLHIYAWLMHDQVHPWTPPTIHAPCMHTPCPPPPPCEVGGGPGGTRGARPLPSGPLPPPFTHARMRARTTTGPGCW